MRDGTRCRERHEIVRSREETRKGERERKRFGAGCRQKDKEREMKVDKERDKCNWMQTAKPSNRVK